MGHPVYQYGLAVEGSYRGFQPSSPHSPIPPSYTCKLKSFKFRIMYVWQFKSSNRHTYLGWHDLCIGASYLNPCVHAGLVVRLHNVSPVHFVSTHSTVIRTCRRPGMSDTIQHGYNQHTVGTMETHPHSM